MGGVGLHRVRGRRVVVAGADKAERLEGLQDMCAQEVVSFTVPLPPVSLRANSRAHWSKRKRDADAYSETVWFRVSKEADNQDLLDDIYIYAGQAWERAKVTYTWRYAGVAPDHGNLGGNTKYLQDILCMAPRSKSGRDRWYLGLVEDDKGITAEYRLEKVAHRNEEAVLVRIERLEARA